MNVLDEYKGAVLSWRERNGYDDSDFLALVEQSPGVFTWVEYASTRYYCPIFVPELDATEEVRARYAEFWQRKHDAAVKARADRDARKAHKGSVVHVARGRKYKGIVGVVAWWGVDQYKSNHHVTHYRAGIDVEGERVYVPAEYLQVDVEGEWVDIVNAREHKSGRLGDTTPEEWTLSNYPEPQYLRR